MSVTGNLPRFTRSRLTRSRFTRLSALAVALGMSAAACGSGSTIVAPATTNPAPAATTGGDTPATTVVEEAPATTAPTPETPTPETSAPTTAAPETTVAPTTTQAPVAVNPDPANLAEWRAFLPTILGPVDSIAEPFEAMVKFFPSDRIVVPEAAELTAVSVSAEAEKGSKGSFNEADPPVVDLYAARGEFLITGGITFEELVAYYDAYEPLATVRADKRDRNSGLEASYQLATNPDAWDEGLLNLTITEADDGIELRIDWAVRNEEQPEMWERMSTQSSDQPTVFGEQATFYLVGVSESFVNTEAHWRLEGSTFEEIAADIRGQLPVGGVEDVAEWDGVDERQLNCTDPESRFCGASIADPLDKGEFTVQWNMSWSRP